jgi:DNA-binding beta-propeller fold protein YncE
MYRILIRTAVAFAAAAFSFPASAEILALLNYESAPEQSLKKLKLSAAPESRREGIAIVDVNPASVRYGHILMDMPLPPDTIAHHVFYDRTLSKGYVTSLGKGLMYVVDLKSNPYRLSTVEVPMCKVGEDVVFSDDNSTWYLTCMGSRNVVVGDVKTGKVKQVIDIPFAYPHGIAIHEGIDRMLVTSTVRPSDMGDAGESIAVVELGTGKVLGSHKVSDKPSPSGDAPVEILFVPGAQPPVAYVTNMFGGTLSAAVWDPAKKDFAVRVVYDFGGAKAGVPLEMYFNRKGDRLYVTTAKPGHFHIFDVSQDVLAPKLRKTLPAGGGAHHVALTPDEKLAYVQNSLLNLPGMSDGTITVIDLEKEEVHGTLDTFSKRGLNPNMIVLLPDWYHPAGH